MHKFNQSKYFLFLLVFGMLITSCGNNSSEIGTSAGNDSNNIPSAIDTTQHPNGVTTGSVISTDTSAMTVDSFVDRKKDTNGVN